MMATKRLVYEPKAVASLGLEGQLTPKLGLLDVSPGGEWVVGQPAFRWGQLTGLQSLGQGEARGVSADGMVVVGGGPAEGYSGDIAFIWDAVNGRRVLKEVLQRDSCLNLSGWNLTTAFAVSDDGRTIVGSGTDPGHFGRAWVVRLPAELPVCPTIPVTSTWGLVILALGMLSAGSLFLKNRRAA